MSTRDERKPFPEPCNCWEYPVTHQHTPGSGVFGMPLAVAPQLRKGQIMEVGTVALKDFTDEQIRKELDRRKRQAAEDAKSKLAIMLPDVLDQVRRCSDYEEFGDEIETVIAELQEAGYGQ